MTPSIKTKTLNDNGTLYYGKCNSPLGTVYVAFDGRRVVGLSFTSPAEKTFREEICRQTSRPLTRSDDFVRPVIDELREYFAGGRNRFSCQPDLSGHTRFQERVLRAAMEIPYGETRTYGWLAHRAGSPNAARAAGQVMAHNRIPIIIPCHRVIGSAGQLCGFAGGLKALDMKRSLLAIEGVTT
jgi:O-6-methylguanine DNA methyltransferase